MNRNIVEAFDAAPILCQVAHQVIFHPDASAFKPFVHTDRLKWTALLASTGAAYTAHGLTKTAASDTATPVTIGSSKKIQTANYQHMVHPRHQDYPPALRVTSLRQPVM